MPSSIELAVPTVALRLAIRLLPEPGWYESGHAELLARGSDPAHEHRWDRGRWERVQRAKNAAGGKTEVDFAFPDPRAAMAALSSIPFHQGYGGSWYYQLPRGSPEALLEWYAALPPDIVVLAPPELAGLFKPPVRATLDWSAIPDPAAQDWFDLSIQLKVDDTELSPDEIALLLRARGKWVRLPRKGWRRLEVAAAGMDGVARTLDQLGIGAQQALTTPGATKHRLHVLQLAGAAADLGERNEAAARHLRRRLDAISQRPPAQLPVGLTATLRPYQKEGFQFLAHLSSLGFGGLLADDMGLGKTVQALAWLLHLRKGRKGRAPFQVLVVCPKSVVHGWAAEAGRFAPGLTCAVYSPGLEEEAGKAELVVANYAQVRLREPWFTGRKWNAAILDEAQFIKNPASQIARSVAALPAEHRLLLTGTPVENRVTDLWSLFAFAQPGLLGSLASFRREYDPKITGSTERLHRRIRHFLLRRTKAEVATDLPARTEDELVVEMEGAQRKLYEAELKRARQQLLGITTARDLDRARFNVLASLLRLRQICCHPALFDPAYAELPSAKLTALMERLEELRDEGHQVLVFSQFVEMLQLIRAGLVERDIGHLMLTGATEDRGALVEQFQRDRSKTVFLLSLKAAGFGLNLTAASYAILYDPWWNPAVEAQAIDRTHRIGQTKPVIAYRLIAADSIELKIRALQRDKAALAAAIVREESLQSVMDLDSLREILS